GAAREDAHVVVQLATLPLADLHQSRVYFDHRTVIPSIRTLSLHDALPISEHPKMVAQPEAPPLKSQTRAVLVQTGRSGELSALRDRKSTRLNSSHVKSSYAVFCLKKKR